MTHKEAALWLDTQPVSITEIVDILRKDGKLPSLVQELILNRTLEATKLAPNKEDELINDFRKQKQLLQEEDFLDFLQRNHLNVSLLAASLTRPHKVVKYREERWGPRANSLYLKHKDKYDKFTYKRLQSDNSDIMQEVFFRLKDGEDSWENLAPQFPGAKPNSDARIEKVPISQIEPALVGELRKAGAGVVIRPLVLNSNTVVVAELESIEPSSFDDEIRTLILREEFDKWLVEESIKMLGKIKLSE